MSLRRFLVLLGFGLLGAAAQCDPAFFIQDFALIDPDTGVQARYDDPSTPLVEDYPLFVGLGSGAHRRQDDLPGVITTLTDRGPNADFAGSKLFPLPAFVPKIYRLRVFATHYKILETIPILDKNGDGVNGLSNFAADVSYGPDGLPLPPNPNGFDPEAIVRLADGSYWISEENCPSLVHVGSDGKILVRIVPVGVKAKLAGATYDIEEKLPAIFGKRRTNRGFESLALSHDEKSLYASMQSPLDNPKTPSRLLPNVRIIQFDLLTETTVGEWVYLESPPGSYASLGGETGPGDDGAGQGDVKVGELVTVGPGRMVLKEGVEKATKLFLITLDGATNILGSVWDDPTTSPSLEVQADLSTAVPPVTPVLKQLLFDSRTDFPELTSKIEACAYMGLGWFLLINDNDFGIVGPVPGSKTQFSRIFIDPALLH